MLLLAFFIVGVIIIDTSISQIFIIDFADRSYRTNILFLFLIIIFYGSAQFIILQLIKHTTIRDQYSRENHLHVIHELVTKANYAIIAIIGSIALSMTIVSSYSTLLLSLAIFLSYLMGAVLLAILSWKFLLWFRSNHKVVVLLYSISSSILLINLIISLLYASSVLQNDPVNITPIRDALADFSAASDTFASLVGITNALAFLTTWLAAVFTLYHYSKKIGKARYWIMVCIPLFYFLSQFQSLFFNTFDDFRMNHPFIFGIIYTLIFNSANTAGGILFGIAFLTISKSVNRRSVKHYIVITGVGMMLLFCSKHSVLAVDNAPYPPFGIASVSFTGFACYLLITGVSYTALSVSRDTELRQFIRKSVQRESSLLHSIGSSEMERQIQRNVMSITNQLSIVNEEEENVKSSLEESDIKQYIKEVLDEVKVKKINGGQD
jgi:hypothetical protein